MTSPDSSDLHAANDSAGLSNKLITEFVKAYFSDRRSERRKRWVWRIIWLGVGLFLIFGAWSDNRYRDPHVAGIHTALIDVQGEIAESTPANADNVMDALRHAFEDKNAQAIVLRISSPGGSPVQAGLINDEIHRLKNLHKKKIYAVCEEMCASAAYYIAVATDQIFVNRASIVGSIGVLMDGFGFTDAIHKLGIERRLLTAGSNKGMLDPFSPVTEQHKQYVQKMLNELHQQFIDVVREGRGQRLHENEDTFSGLFWTGEDAIKQGLADHLGSLDQVARDVVKAQEIVDYTPKDNVAERLAKRFGASIGGAAVEAFRGAVLR